MANLATPPANGGRRRRTIVWLLVAFALAGAAYGAWWALEGRYTEFTDDAYVAGHVVQITPQVAGTVVAVRAEDTAYVRAGQVLVELDKADAEVALAQAEAQLARSVRQVRTLFATDAQLAANVKLREAELARAREDVARRERAIAGGAVSAEDLGHARDAVRSAQAALVAAREQLAAGRALTDRTTLADHPEVQAAAAKLREAYLALARTELPAPVAGFVAKRSVQVGQRVAAGTPLMAVVPLDAVWVDANFKESQLAHVREGQPVLLHADLYGDEVAYHGRVAGFAAGTGSAFALLPAQNATGNWIKVVQRLPLRIALDARELAAHPLHLGLSMRAEIDTHGRSGERLQRRSAAPAHEETRVFETMERRAEARVAEIIAANGGRAAAGARRRR
jgi:membrane fusion protein (multidrug efflux system)